MGKEMKSLRVGFAASICLALMCSTAHASHPVNVTANAKEFGWLSAIGILVAFFLIMNFVSSKRK